MAEYSYKELWDRDKLEERERRQNQIAKAQAELAEGMEVMEGLSTGFWVIIRDQFIKPKLADDRIDTCAPEDILAIREQRRILRELIKFLELKAQAGTEAGRFLKTLKNKEA